MRFIEYAQKMETIKYLVQHKRTGTPAELAQKLGLSERTILRMIQQLKESGFPVHYNRFRFSYEEEIN